MNAQLTLEPKSPSDRRSALPAPCLLPVFHANSSTGGPVDKLGPKAALPALLVALSTLALALQGTGTAGPISRAMGVSRLRPAGLLAVGLAAALGGFAFGLLAASANAKNAP